MEHEEAVTAIHELTEFATSIARTLQNHKDTLQRHEEILSAQYTAGVTHRDAIEALRKDMLAFGRSVELGVTIKFTCELKLAVDRV